MFRDSFITYFVGNDEQQGKIRSSHIGVACHQYCIRIIHLIDRAGKYRVRFWVPNLCRLLIFQQGKKGEPSWGVILFWFWSGISIFYIYIFTNRSIKSSTKTHKNNGDFNITVQRSLEAFGFTEKHSMCCGIFVQFSVIIRGLILPSTVKVFIN